MKVKLKTHEKKKKPSIIRRREKGKLIIRLIRRSLKILNKIRPLPWVTHLK